MMTLPPIVMRDAGLIDEPARAGRRLRPRVTGGFTLVELMIVVAIVAILAAIAYPSYTRHITKTRRVAAEGCLSQYASYMERWYTTKLSYAEVTNATLPALECASAAQTGNHYTYTVSSAAATYTLQATPSTAQAARDTQCGSLTLNNQGARTASGSAGVTGCW